MEFKEIYMQRCIDLAKCGAGSVAPNPMVGAVLVQEDRIIGEGYHQVYGGPHAEVNCIRSVKDADRKLIPLSTLYVSLEPCAHFGKTPPCANLILSEKIPNVVIGSKDPFEAVNGKGIDILQSRGVNVVQGILEKECDDLNKRFFTFHRLHRPYIILKWAQTADLKMSSGSSQRLKISNQITDRMVHKWRSEEAAIMVGTATAENDNPLLTNRLWTGNNPVRIVIDRDLNLSSSLHLLDSSVDTLIFYTNGNRKQHQGTGIRYILLQEEKNLLPQIMQSLFESKILSVIIEGGPTLLNSFISSGTWDEARVITNTRLCLKDSNFPAGLSAPQLIDAHLQEEVKIGHDQVQTFIHINPR